VPATAALAHVTAQIAQSKDPQFYPKADFAENSTGTTVAEMQFAHGYPQLRPYLPIRFH
jgi:hypothetical protein